MQAGCKYYKETMQLFIKGTYYN